VKIPRFVNAFEHQRPFHRDPLRQEFFERYSSFLNRPPTFFRSQLCSQPTLSRLENAPSLKDAIRLSYALVDQWMDSHGCEPASVVLDIDDTFDVVHGHQQLSLFNTHYDERCFLPFTSMTPSELPVPVVLRPGKTPSGVEVRASAPVDAAYPQALAEDAHPVSRRRALRVTGDDGVVRSRRGLRLRPSRHEALVEEGGRNRGRRSHGARHRRQGCGARIRRDAAQGQILGQRARAIARIEATGLGLDIGFVVTNLAHGSAEGDVPVIVEIGGAALLTLSL
jgi:hypothetical protein